MSKNQDKNWSFLICLTLTLVTLAVFYQVHSFEFLNYDDQIYISENPNIHNGITLKAVKWAFTAASNIYFWHPLTWLSHILDWQLYGNNAGGHHITNLIFHILNTLLLFFVLKQMTRAIWPSAFVAALFALHPLHVESVAWIYERKDVLSTFFWFLTMWAYVRYVRGPKIAGYLLVVAFLALGLLSKPMLVTLPFVLLLLDYWPLDRLSSKSDKAGKKHSLPYLLVEKVPLFAMVAVSCIITFNNQKKIGAMGLMENLSLSVRLANTSISYMQYIIKMVWPARLAFFYPHPVENVSILFTVTSAVLLAAATILVLRFAKKHPYLFTGWFWYLGTLVPVIGIVQVGRQAMADHYTYIPLTGLFIIIAWGLPEFVKKWPHRKIVPWSSSLIVLSALIICTFFQLRYWKDDISLCQHALAVTTNNYHAHYSMTKELLKQGRNEEAVLHCSEALRIEPDDLNAQIGLTSALLAAGKLDQTEIECQKFLQNEPNDPNLLNNLGVAFGRQGKFDQAVKYLTKALENNPDFAEAHTNLGYALVLQGKYDQAAGHFVEVLRLDPRSSLAHYHLGCILVQKGRLDEGITHFKQALLINPDFTDAKNSLNAALAEKLKLRNPENIKK
jgi:tetratricopeptide (TPR) repeat protein